MQRPPSVLQGASQQRTCMTLLMAPVSSVEAEALESST